MDKFIFDVQRFDDINNTVDGGTWTGTDADEEHGTTDYDIATEKTTVYSALYGMGGNDNLSNNYAFANVTIDGGTGNDRIYNRGANGSLIGGAGDDYIDNSGVDNAKAHNATIDGGAGADVISNRGDNALITAGDNADSVYSSGEKATITGGAGADTLNSYGNYSSIEGGEGDDNLTASSSNVTVHGGAGNDTLNFKGGSNSIASNGIVEDTEDSNYFHAESVKDSTIIAGAGDDSVYSANIEDVTINLGAGANSVNSEYDKNVTIQALGGDDTINIYDGSNINLNVGDGANRINVANLNDSNASGYTITAGAGADSIGIDVNDVIINAGDGDNTITTGGYEAGNNVTINTGSGADFISNYYRTDKAKVSRQENVLINAGAGNDTIDNTGSKTTIDAGEGDDIISSYYGENVSISGGAGADEIFGNNATLNGGADNDTIRAGDNTLIQYAAGDGNDLIQNFGIDDTLSIGGDYSTVTIGGDVILTVGENNITLSGAASLETLNIVGGEAVENWATVTTGTISTAIDKSATVASGTTGDDTIKTEQISDDTTARLIEGNGGNDSILNFVSKVTISGGADKDSVVSSADNVVIQTGGGNDYIQGATKGNVNITIDAGDDDDEIDTYGTNASINGGAGNDSIKISADSEKVTVIAGEGSDTVVNTATDSFIDGGAGADSIHNDSGNVTIDAGADDDVITSYGDKVSISGGAGADKIIVTNSYDGVGTISGGIGDDTVSIGSGNFLLEYTSGDGADVINGFKANDTLYIDGKYSTATIGTDLLVTVGSGILTLQGAATLESVNVLNEDDISAASFVTNLQQKTEYGYPVIAGLFFHPTEYHGFETLPSSYYASSETLTINSSDGLELTGYHYTPENPNDKWVILVHGYGHNHKHMNGFAMQYLTNNYHVLEIDQRAAGDSEGEWLTMGAAEGNDVALWTQKIAEINSKAKITLHGVSMGAATAMLAAANSGLTNVTSLVEDCGYTSVLKLVDIVKSGYPALGDPEYVSLVSDTAGKLTGHKLTEAAPIDSIGSVTIPSMFITGTSDAVVSPSMLETLYAASGAEVKEIFTVEGATHGVSALTDSIGYGNAVFRFNAEAAGEGWLTSNVTDSITLRGTKYDDSITSSGSNVTIRTGEGDDTITNSGSNNVYLYDTGDGNDVIIGFAANDTIIISEGTGQYATAKSGNDVILTVDKGKITLGNAANFETLNIQGNAITSQEFNNTVDGAVITGTIIDDTISNHGSNVTIDAIGGNDYISNVDNNKTLIDAGDGNDFILNSLKYEIVTPEGGGATVVTYSDTSIVAGAGNDTVRTVGGDNVSISAGDGDDNISSRHSYYQTIDGGAGNDLVEITEGHYENIYGGDGNDSIIGAILFETVKGDWAMGGYANIDGGAGADYISVGYSNNATINGGDGEDVIITYGLNSQINGGVGNDSIALISNGEETLNSKGTTITAGVGDDTITGDGSGVVYQYNTGDGNDVLIGVTDSDTLVIDSGEGKGAISTVDNDVILTVGESKITLQNAASFEKLNIEGDFTTVSDMDNTVNNKFITGTDFADTITNSGSNVTISGLGGDDEIYSSGTNVSINGGAGNDTIGVSEDITNNGVIEIEGAEGNDYIFAAGITNNGDLEIDGDEGNDTISVAGVTNTGKLEIDGDEGDDVISVTNILKNDGDIKIEGDLGNDTITVNHLSNAIAAGIYGNDGDDLINVSSSSSSSLTVEGGAGNDTIIGSGAGIVYHYSEGDGNDIIIGVTNSDTLLIDSAYSTAVSGNDLVITISSNQNTLTLRNAAKVTPHMSVALIAKGDEKSSYESVALASENADNNSTVTVTANSTETSAINSTKNLTIQFAESGLGVYNVTGGNFVSADSSKASQFTIDSKRVLSNANSLLINNGATATLDGYAITGTSNGYTFSLQNNPFTINGVEYSGTGAATFDTATKVTLTSGAIVTDESFVTSESGIVLAAGSYTLNGDTFSTTATQTVYLNSDGNVYFDIDSNTVTYNGMAFSGKGSVTVADGLPTITAGVDVSNVDKVVLTASGQNAINGKNFWLTEGIADGITVGTFNGGISAAHIILEEDFPEDAGKTFYEEAYISNDNDYTIRLDHEGIRSIYGISSGASISGKASLEGEPDTLGSVLQLGLDGEGTYNLGDKAYTVTGTPINENYVIGLVSRFYDDGSSSLRTAQYLNGTISGDFSSAVSINGGSVGVEVEGDKDINVIAEESGVKQISGISNGASIISAGKATKVTTDEEGNFVFRSPDDTQQAFTVSGDSSVDFILRNYTDENGKPTMQVEGVNNFENGYYSFNSDTAYHGINVGETINASDELEMVFSDVATFTIVDSKVVSVGGIDQVINNLTSDVSVHATGAMTVNNVTVNVTGDNDFNVIVENSKTTGLNNISSGASVSVANMYVTTDNKGDFKIGTDTYTVEDTLDNSVTFTTDIESAVTNITGLVGTIKTNRNELTLNGTEFTTTNTDVTITSAAGSTDNYISKVEGLTSGDSVKGAFNQAEILMPSSVGTDSGIVTINDRSYTLSGDTNGTTFKGDAGGIADIIGLDTDASLRFGAAGNYWINGTYLTVNVGDVAIGTSEDAAYIYDPNNVPPNVNTMTDEEIAAQTGITTDYNKTETDTMLTTQLIENGGSELDGSMELVVDNSDSIIEQTADFSKNTGKKKVTLEGGDQSIVFNNEGGNVAVIDGDASGEKNVSLGGGGDLVIIKETNSPVNITSISRKDTIVTAGNDVLVNMNGGAKIVPNSGNVTLNNYDANSGAGIQLSETSDIARAIANDNITLDAGAVSFGNARVNFGGGNENSSVINLFNNQGKKQKIAYTHSDGGDVDISGEREHMLLVGNNTGGKGNSKFMAGSGNDTAIGGAGDYFDLGAGNNYVSINKGSNVNESATVAMTSTSGQTEVDGFNFSYGENGDRVRIDTSNAQVSFKNGKLTFNVGGSALILNVNININLADSADLIEDDNFIGNTTLDEIAPITYEQGDYQFGEENWTVASGQPSLVSAQ